MLTKLCGNLCLLCLPEKYTDVPQDGRGKIRLHGAAFKETNSMTRALEMADKQQREKNDGMEVHQVTWREMSFRQPL